MQLPKQFIPDSALMEKATETTFLYKGQPVRVFHYNGEIVGMTMEDVCKCLGMTVEEAIDCLNEEPGAVQ